MAEDTGLYLGTVSDDSSCLLTGCGKPKAGDSEYCSPAHEEKAMKAICDAEGLEGVCKSFHHRPGKKIMQYRCLSCGYSSQQFCCETCMAVCHRGHDIQASPAPLPQPCDCGSDWQCASMPASKRGKRPDSFSYSTSDLASSASTSSILSTSRAGSMSFLAHNDGVCWFHSNMVAVNNCAKCDRPLCRPCMRVKGARVYCKDCFKTVGGGGCCGGLLACFGAGGS